MQIQCIPGNSITLILLFGNTHTHALLPLECCVHWIPRDVPAIHKLSQFNKLLQFVKLLVF